MTRIPKQDLCQLMLTEEVTHYHCGDTFRGERTLCAEDLYTA